MTVTAEKPKKIAAKKIAIVVHQEHSRPGRVGALLEKRGYELHRLCPNLGCNLPDDMSDYAGVVIFGGPMSANDCGSLAGIKCELEWIPKVVEAGVPFLGLCLGAQLLTRAAGGRVAYEALQDVKVSAMLLRAIAEGTDFGEVHARAEADAQIDPSAEGLVIGAEQSNTSIVYGHTAILKVFRRLEPGPNPDAEIHRALHAVGSRHIAQPLGEITGPVEGQLTTLALLTEFFANSAEGWAMATSSVRDLMSEGDLRADEVGGDFAAESHRLGEAVAAVHNDLARAFGTTVATHEELTRILDRMVLDAQAAMTLVPALAEHRAAILGTFARASDHPGGISIQRIHGDLHLGQVLRTLNGWSIIDFEGEPSKPLEYRRAMQSPLKDIAGMLRSYDYAARGLVISPRTDAQHKYRAAEWATRNRRAFSDGYAEAAGNDPRLAGSLLRAFELDKAIYEVVYEHGHRPLWVDIPMQAVVALINTGGTS